jgi:hypothetical protein
MDPESPPEKDINPYASPHHSAIQSCHPEHRSRDGDAAALAELIWPSIVLMVLSAVWAGSGIHALLVVATTMFASGRTQSLIPRERLFIVPAALLSILIFCGALSMLRGRHYRFALATSFLACFPCVSPVVVLGIPFGFWALTVLTRPHVRAAFQRENVDHTSAASKPT